MRQLTDTLITYVLSDGFNKVKNRVPSVQTNFITPHLIAETIDWCEGLSSKKKKVQVQSLKLNHKKQLWIFTDRQYKELVGMTKFR